MRSRLLLLFLFLICVGNLSGIAQKQDSIIKTQADNEKESLQKLERFSQKNKFTKWLHKLAFKRTQQTQQTSRQAIDPRTIDFDYYKYQGKIIRNIHIETMDPFGYSIEDSTRAPRRTVEHIGNRLHLKTKDFTIKNLLLFKKNQELDSLKLMESERIIRSQGFVRRISIKPIPISADADSVDISIRVLDSWSIFPSGSLSTSSMRLRLNTRNFGGLGHFVTAQYHTRYKEGRNGFYGQYQVNNIANTFTSAGILYNLDLVENQNKIFYVERPFYSPLARWAGGIRVNQSLYRDSIANLHNVRKLENFKSNNLDVWGGIAFPLYETNKNLKVITNIFLTGRFFISDYLESPGAEFDPYNYYADQNMYLFSAGISSLNYVQDRFIFNYDRIEDIAVGKIFSVTGGIQNKNKIRRPYIASLISMGRYTGSGYYGAEMQWGTFFNKDRLEESVFRIQGTYFSQVFHWGRWKFRHFVNPEIVYGYNRLDFEHDRINLNGRTGIDGFHSYDLRGTKKAMLNLQLQSYAPTDWLGFRLSPFFTASVGMIGESESRFLDEGLYSSLTLGILISNDYTNFSNFHFSFSFYPNIPGQGKNIIRANNLRNSNFQLQQFNYGRPGTVPYN